MFKILIPCSGDKHSNLDNLCKSIDNQIGDFNVECFFLEDQISENFRSKLEKLCGNSSNKFLVENFYGRRLYGLFNICRFLDDLGKSDEESESIIGIIDCDDFLWGNDCFKNIKNEYDNDFDIVWTANELEGIGVNFSAPLNEALDVYKHAWVSSHFKTFKLKHYLSVNQKNFLDENGEWFTACYDQALMLPIIHNAINSGGKTKYIDKVHYIYHGDLNPDEGSNYRQAQLNNESFIRSRGYINE